MNRLPAKPAALSALLLVIPLLAAFCPDSIEDRPPRLADRGIPDAVEYGAVQRQLDSAFAVAAGGVRYPPAGRYYLRPTSISIYPHGRQAVVRVRFDGSAKGVGYLIGTPHYDAARGVLSFPDLDYTIETKNVLLKLVKWEEGEQFRNDLRARMTIAIGATTDRASARP